MEAVNVTASCDTQNTPSRETPCTGEPLTLVPADPTAPTTEAVSSSPASPASKLQRPPEPDPSRLIPQTNPAAKAVLLMLFTLVVAPY